MNGTDFHLNFNRFFDELRLTSQSGAHADQMELPTSAGEGGIRRFLPRHDMEVVLSEYALHRDCVLSLATEAPMVELSYTVQGGRGLRVDGEEYSMMPGMCSLQFINQADYCFEFGGKEAFTMISIGIPVTSFHHFMEAADRTRSVDFAQIMGWRSFRSFQETTLPAATVILDRLMQHVRNGRVTNIEIECSVLELLSMSFRSFLADGLPGRSKLGRTDMLKIREARDILLERMAEPPSLLELSRLIGLNDYKLKTGFKEMYGATVYGYLREQRLEKAYRLLTEGKMNVIDVSCAVGYSNSSYFAEAFRTKYGINPGSLVRRSSASFLHDR